MRDSIARALAWVLALLVPSARRLKPGRHSAAYLANQAAPGAWETPCPAPTPPHVIERHTPLRGEDVRLVRPYVAGFQPPQTEAEWQMERRRAAAFASAGYDYPYSYPGAPTLAGAVSA
ncbi:hypothetical protein [Streptomyces sp. CB02923]|uniref:hypothetical protein n=1 Tax=Streptomyces sp. CB02923 TaxID=1718985 RepID=UPI00093ED2FF|nr:hypothetical protein [Streptomyces sp. CB02923]